MKERTVLFGPRRSLVGILTEPVNGIGEPAPPAVVLLNAGVVHRVGPNRLHVKLARRLAALGHRVLRFDFSGVGDSAVREDSLPLERAAVEETREAMGCLTELSGAERFVLVAICSGAAFSVRTALVDERVVGVALVNPAGHRWGTEAELSRTMLHHYRRMAAFRSSPARTLRKILALDFGASEVLANIGRGLRESLSRSGGAPPPAAGGHVGALRTIAERGVEILMLYSEADEGLDYHRLYLEEALRPLERSGRLETRIVAGANHTFTLLAHQRAFLDVTADWIGALSEGPTPDGEVGAAPPGASPPSRSTPHVR